MDIFDVAKACNVSKSTVSRILNNHPYVNEEKRKRVLQYIEENNYVPNNIATYFRNRTTKSIGISIPYIDHPFFSKVSYELTKNFYEDGYKSFIHQTFCSPNKEEEVLISLKKNEIDAVILCSVENQVDIIEEYSKYGLIISSNDTNQTKSISNFHFDEFNIGKDVTEYLIKKGINNIAICIDNPFNGAQKLRLEGYKEALLENKINFKEEYIFSSAFTIDDGIKIGMKIRESHKEIQGIYTGNDYVSAGVFRVLGNEVFLIGTDNHDICKILTPQLSSVSLPIERMSKDISSHVIKQLSLNEKEVIDKLYSYRIISDSVAITSKYS
ncbi:LacI family transcriptional regulator [Staphylococcus chromogenes]|uniref:LacI family DNA-binding transcriptional regulator n=1 Tax=Staphylococcus chromogenes TaxID=46126 RepID=UPI000E67DA45|nr:LacI family DNA-binding transcriptional regulator [Staphylococcus chromogenes]RIM00914.1 LacI family transcriptional regulator [Staphylococcus chromogenes]